MTSSGTQALHWKCEFWHINELESKLIENLNKNGDLRNFLGEGKLIYPCEKLIQLVDRVEKIFISIHGNGLTFSKENGIIKRIYEEVKKDISTNIDKLYFVL